jgi:S-formylglutathione hydrolase FrmB
MRWFYGILLIALFSLTVCCNRGRQDSGERPEVGISLDSLVRRVAIPSNRMGKVFNANVILPESYFLDSSLNFYPVVYLLHGYTGNYANWYERVPDLGQLATFHDLIIVMPEGNSNSWYLDSYLDSTMLFYSYISQEVPQYIDANFRTYQDARFRAITGLSMGGHGALSIALEHPDWFGLAGSMSGVVDLRPYPENWEISSQLGEYETDSVRWAQHSVVEMVGVQKDAPHLIIDCGTEDLLITDNRVLHERLLAQEIAHTYTERPGQHDWLYWEEAVEYQLMYFAKKFKEG